MHHTNASVHSASAKLRLARRRWTETLTPVGATVLFGSRRNPVGALGGVARQVEDPPETAEPVRARQVIRLLLGTREQVGDPVAVAVSEAPVGGIERVIDHDDRLALAHEV